MIKSYLVTWSNVNKNLSGITSQIDNYSVINSDAPENPEWNNLGMVWYYKQFHFAVSDFVDNSDEDIMCWYTTDATSPNLATIFERASSLLSESNWIYAPHFSFEAWTRGATNLKYFGDGIDYASQTDGILTFFKRDVAVLMKEYMDYLDSKENLVEMRSGWGLDYVWSVIAILNGKHILRDSNYIVTHPQGSSYDHGKASAEMWSVLSRFFEFCETKGWDRGEAEKIFSKISYKMSSNNSIHYSDFYNVEQSVPYHIISLDDSRAVNKNSIQDEMGIFDRVNVGVLDARVDSNLKQFLYTNRDFKMNLDNPKVGEIGCFGSHFLAWKYLVDSELDYLVIFEDDAMVEKGFKEKLIDRLHQLPEDYDVFSVYADDNQDDRFRPKHAVSEFISKGYQDWSTLCYVVSKKGAKRLLEVMSENGMNMPVDWYIFRNGEAGVFDVYTVPPRKKLPIYINDITGSQVQADVFYKQTDSELYLEFMKFLEKNGESKYSQLQQDKFAAFITQEKSGFFVEFGACDGVHLSNTILLEDTYGWSGILAEPSPYYFNLLKDNRKAICDSRCVWSKSGETISFTEVDLDSDKGLSGITELAFQDHHSETRRNNSITYDVETVSLDDLLDSHNAPQIVDYISIDTEGSELNILEAYSFSREFKFISVEHNGTDNRDKIYSLLTSKGYDRILTECSKWDDWYIKKDLL